MTPGDRFVGVQLSLLAASFVDESVSVPKVFEVETCQVVLAWLSEPLLTLKPEMLRAPRKPTDPFAGLEMDGVLTVGAGAAVVKLVADEYGEMPTSLDLC